LCRSANGKCRSTTGICRSAKADVDLLIVFAGQQATNADLQMGFADEKKQNADQQLSIAHQQMRLQICFYVLSIYKPDLLISNWQLLVGKTHLLVCISPLQISKR
jgi:hypothetical protein